MLAAQSTGVERELAKRNDDETYEVDLRVFMDEARRNLHARFELLSEILGGLVIATEADPEILRLPLKRMLKIVIDRKKASNLFLAKMKLEDYESDDEDDEIRVRVPYAPTEIGAEAMTTADDRYYGDNLAMRATLMWMQFTLFRTYGTLYHPRSRLPKSSRYLSRDEMLSDEPLENLLTRWEA